MIASALPSQAICVSLGQLCFTCFSPRMHWIYKRTFQMAHLSRPGISPVFPVVLHSHFSGSSFKNLKKYSECV